MRTEEIERYYQKIVGPFQIWNAEQAKDDQIHMTSEPPDPGEGPISDDEIRVMLAKFLCGKGCIAFSAMKPDQRARWWAWLKEVIREKGIKQVQSTES